MCLNSNGFGIFTQAPSAPLHVNGSVIIQSDTGALSFYNAAGTSKASVNFNESAQKITVTNSTGDVAIDATGGGVSIATDTDLVLDGAAIFTAAAGAATGTYLRIKLNGTYYKLALLADV